MLVLHEEYEIVSQFFVMQTDWLMNQGWIGVRRAGGDGSLLFIHRHVSVLRELHVAAC